MIVHEHELHICVEEHGNDNDFVVIKIDLWNAFNLASCQALLDECRHTFLSSSNGQLGVTVITPYCCLPWVR